MPHICGGDDAQYTKLDAPSSLLLVHIYGAFLFNYSLQTLSPVFFFFFRLYCSLFASHLLYSVLVWSFVAFDICYFCSIHVYRNKRMKNMIADKEYSTLSKMYSISHLQRWKAISLMPSFMNIYIFFSLSLSRSFLYTPKTKWIMKVLVNNLKALLKQRIQF